MDVKAKIKDGYIVEFTLSRVGSAGLLIIKEALRDFKMKHGDTLDGRLAELLMDDISRADLETTQNED